MKGNDEDEMIINDEMIIMIKVKEWKQNVNNVRGWNDGGKMVNNEEWNDVNNKDGIIMDDGEE
jgi:hypothetical protein